ncbi:MAG TPA: sulfur carrier protein ThiS [Rhizomicrobium sp.]|jgi:thiazole synthase|nr:sulfur carrier protein ThiS [Rhizomicrobium sp.]
MSQTVSQVHPTTRPPAITVTLNGETRMLDQAMSLDALLRSLGFDPAKIAVERNLEIVPRSTYQQVMVAEGDRLEIVHFIGGGNAPVAPPAPAPAQRQDRPFVIAGRSFTSRLIIGTGKYKSYEENARALEASGAQIVTVAVRRVNLTDPSQPMLVDFIDPKKVMFLPNTAGCFTGEEAVRTLRLAREAGGWSLVKLEVLGEKKLLYPDMIETLRATEMLSKDGFQVMVYCSDDPLMAKRLEDCGAVAIMPLASPIGSGMGITSTVNLRMIIADSKVPVIVDAGIGTASDAAVAMELGCDAVITNTGIAHADDPVRMARAMKLAVEAGREAWLAGRMPRKPYADPSSPLTGLI